MDTNPLTRDYTPFCCSGVTYRAEYVTLPTGVELLSVAFTPPEPAVAPVILFIPGFVSLIENFRETLVELTRTHAVFYVETREKSTAKISPDHRFTVDEITSDIGHYAEFIIPEGVPFQES